VFSRITRSLQAKEIAHRELTSLQVVETMHERKAAMADAADAFVMLPGGYGTLDEFFEAVTWTQLGIHANPGRILVRAHSGKRVVLGKGEAIPPPLDYGAAT
jgi:uncharacterized protein (TIGR00730 family)